MIGVGNRARSGSAAGLSSVLLPRLIVFSGLAPPLVPPGRGAL